MKTASNIKRGSIVTNTVSINVYGKTLPVGSIGQVIRRKRATNNPCFVKFTGDVSGITVTLDQIKLAELNNEKTPKVNDIFAADWGYEQTQTTWFKVKKIKNRSVTVVIVGENRINNKGGMCGYATVNPQDEGGNEKTYRLLYDMNGNPSFKMSSYARAFLVEDIKQPRFFSEWH